MAPAIRLRESQPVMTHAAGISLTVRCAQASLGNSK